MSEYSAPTPKSYSHEIIYTLPGSMNPKIAQFGILAIALLLSLTVVGKNGNSFSRKDKFSHGKPALHKINNAPAIRAGAMRAGSPASNEDETRHFRKGFDAAMHGSVNALCDVGLPIVGIVHVNNLGAFPPTGNRPAQQVFFRILFRLIISPNAP